MKDITWRPWRLGDGAKGLKSGPNATCNSDVSNEEEVWRYGQESLEIIKVLNSVQVDSASDRELLEESVLLLWLEELPLLRRRQLIFM